MGFLWVARPGFLIWEETQMQTENNKISTIKIKPCKTELSARVKVQNIVTV